MGGAVPPLPNAPSWRGAQLGEHRDNFTKSGRMRWTGNVAEDEACIQNLS